MKDYMIRGIDKEGNFRFFGITAKDTVGIACDKHQTTPVVSATLGRTMMGTLMMGAMLKKETERVNVSIKGDGPIQGIVVEADGKGNVKGYSYQPQVEIPLKENGKLDVSGAIGNAVMTVCKDIGLKDPYVGQVAMLSGEIAEDFTYYFATSEQTNSAVVLGVLVDRDYSIGQAGGMIIQVLPDATEEAISNLEAKLKEFSSITYMLEQGKTIEEIVTDLLGDIQIMDKTNIQFKCDCSKARMEKALISLGSKELMELAKEEENTELVCHFCNDTYLFSTEELETLANHL